MSARRYAGLLLLLGLQRVAELLYSERNERRVARREPNAPQAGRSVFNGIAVLHLGLFTMPALERALRGRPPVAVATAGWMTTIAAIALRVSVIATLREEWNVRAIVPSDVKVSDRGPYRFVRHPNYVALALEFVGVPMIGGAYISAVVLSAVNALLLSRRIREEEALLLAIPEYRQKMAHKPRFFPRLVSVR